MSDRHPASCLPVAQGDCARVKLADLLPLIEWAPLGCEAATFRLREDRLHRDGEVSLEVTVTSVPDTRFDSGKPEGVGNWRIAEAVGYVRCAPDFATIEEAMDVIRTACRLAVLHEVDETLRFAGMLPFDPHTRDREQVFPPTEECP